MLELLTSAIRGGVTPAVHNLANLIGEGRYKEQGFVRVYSGGS